MKEGNNMALRSRGFTLPELMIVVAIIGILAAIAYPNYQSYVLKSNRSVAKAALLDAQSRLEEHFINNKSYTGDMTDLGFGSDPLYLNSSGNSVAAASGDRIYAIEITANTTTSYTVTAAPQLTQAGDKRCTSLSIDSLGVKASAPGDVNECW